MTVQVANRIEALLEIAYHRDKGMKTLELIFPTNEKARHYKKYAYIPGYVKGMRQDGVRVYVMLY